MGLWAKLMNARSYVRKQRGPDSYFQYKRKREHERKDAESGRERARDSASQELADEQRGRNYQERYTADREKDIAEQPDEPGPGPG